MKILVCLSALIAFAVGRSAYRFSDGYLDILGGEPNRVFDCTGRPYGYYADVAADCQVFHICLPIPNAAGEVVDMAQYSFFCGNQTVFSQDSLTCAHPQFALPCEESEILFDISNADFGVIPENENSIGDFGRRTPITGTSNNNVGRSVATAGTARTDLRAQSAISGTGTVSSDLSTGTSSSTETGANDISIGTSITGTASSDLSVGIPNAGTATRNLRNRIPNVGTTIRNLDIGTPSDGTFTRDLNIGTSSPGAATSVLSAETSSVGTHSSNLGIQMSSAGIAASSLSIETPLAGSSVRDSSRGNPNVDAANNELRTTSPADDVRVNPAVGFETERYDESIDQDLDEESNVYLPDSSRSVSDDPNAYLTNAEDTNLYLPDPEATDISIEYS
ncbi:uncharacterized protein [Palaemon carinicauda]|uniref:uncharacterized protein n=1 Tax=Palaemon carinicauda TaxID=392227 RepID=UPI0035B5E7A7